MKKWTISCLVAWLGVCSVQAQTVTLPTKKKTKTTQETEVKEKKETTDNQKEKDQKGTIKLPTVKKTETPEAAQEQTVVTAQQGETVAAIPLLPTVKRKTAPRAKPIVKKPKKEDNEIYESAEHMPTYPGGVPELMKFIEEHLQYPEPALTNDSVDDVTIIQVSFIVEKDGTPKDFEVIDEHNVYLEAEAVRVLSLMPKWNPATQHGVKVRVEYVVPVKFKKPIGDSREIQEVKLNQ